MYSLLQSIKEGFHTDLCETRKTYKDTEVLEKLYITVII